MSRQDLHIHSTASDGSYTPDEIVTMVRKQNVGVFSITDHETIKGVKKIVVKKELLDGSMSSI